DSIKKYLKGDNFELHSKKIARLILLEFVWRKLKGLKIYDKQRSFDRITIDNAFSKFQPNTSFIVDISNERALWIFVSLFEYEANPIEMRYYHQCNSIISLFLVHTNYIPDRSMNKENIFSIIEYFSDSLSKTEIELLDRLQNDVSKFAKLYNKQLTMYIQNRRNSSKINGCSPLQNSNGLINLKPAIAYFAYTQRYGKV